MAKLVVARGWEASGSLGADLRQALTDEYVIACGPTVGGHHLDAVLVGPQGLFVLHAKEWEGEILAAERRPWRERLPSGRVVVHSNLRSDARRATRALRAFLRDEFPSLRPPIQHFVLFVKPGAKLATYGATEPPCTTMDYLVRDVNAAIPQSQAASLGDEVRQELAQALVDRQLTTTQRAEQRFIFRSGGLLGIGKKAWTIRKVIKHIDRYPEDGVHHLRNGTLERWFADQGASHLATLAREAMSGRGADPRVSLERFLLATGLVRRPRLSARPRRVSMGYVLTGERVSRRLRLRKGRGRGYLYGTLRPSAPWLRVDPDTFHGSLDATVSIDTEPLLITEQPSKASISVHSNASDEAIPIPIPVRVFVATVPSVPNRYLVRPLAGLIVAGLLGAGAGWALGRFGIQAPAWLTRLASPVFSPTAGWAALTGLLWAVLGLLRGFTQPPAWPLPYATGRWLLKVLVWSAALSILAAGVLWAGAGAFADLAIGTGESLPASIILSATALAVLPATAGEVWSARRREEAEKIPSSRRTLRRALWAVAGVALVLVAAAGARLIGPARDKYDLDARATSVRGWAADQLAGLQGSLRGVVDGLYLRYYDRRAPARATSTSPTPTPPPAEEGDSP